MPWFRTLALSHAVFLCCALSVTAHAQTKESAASKNNAKVRIGEMEVPADCALARKEHPRMLFTKADLPGIRARIAKPGLKPIYDLLKQTVDDQMAKGPGHMSKQEPSRFVVPAGLLYHITGEEKYGQVCREATMRAPFDVYATQGGYGYDLAYDLMTAEERATCETKMLVQARKGKANSTNPTPLTNALGIWGNGTHDEEMAKIISLEYPALLRRKAYLDEWAADRGGDGNSHDYIGQHEYVGTMGALQAWRAATGEDLFVGFNWARTMGAYHVYNILPDNRGTAHLGNDRYGAIRYPVETGATNFVSIAQAQWQDGVTGWWCKNIVCGSTVYYHVLERYWGMLLWYDPEVPEIPSSQVPQDMLFKTRGYLYARSDWNPDATFVNFSCGRFEGDGRNNSDANAFMIYRKAYLACDSGLKDEYDPKIAVPVPDKGHYWTETIAHNSITVGTANHPSKHDATLFGGQVGRVPKEWLSLYGLPVTDDNMITRQAGQIKAYETSPEFVYTVGDATNAYDPHVVKNFTRQFVYIRPGAIVIFDRVGAKNPDDIKRWYLHTMDKPECLDGTLTLDTAIHPDGHFLANGTTLRATRLGSALFSKTLLPEKPIIRVLGGPGHQFEVNGINHDLKPEWWKKMDNNEGRATLERLGSGWWRVEVEPENKQADDVFLHVLWATDDGAKQMFPVKTIEKNGKVGVQFSADGSDVEVSFAKTGDVAGYIKITKGGKVVCDRALAAEIEDNYQKWNNDPRFKEWMTNPYMRSWIGEKDQDLFKAGKPK
jgi:hypothetical protein